MNEIDDTKEPESKPFPFPLHGPERPVSNAEFLREVFRDLPAGAVTWVTTFAGDPSNIGPEGWKGFAFDPSHKVAEIVGGKNSFFCISSFTGRPDPNRPGVRFGVSRRKALHTATHAFVLDDIGHGPGAKVPVARLPAHLEPSWVLETSAGNFQVGYVMETPVTDGDLAARFLDALVADGLQVEKDPGMKGVTRYVRLPAGLNGKEKYKIDGEGEGWDHRLVHWKPSTRYQLEDLCGGFGLDLTEIRSGTSVLGRRAGRSSVTYLNDPWVPILEQAVDRMERPNDKGPDGIWIDVCCPWVHEHSGQEDNGSAYCVGGGYKCNHGHCESRDWGSVRGWLLHHPDTAVRQAANDLAGELDFGLAPILMPEAPPLPLPPSFAASNYATLLWMDPSFDRRALPIRPWISERVLLRGYVSLMAGPTAIGKSTFDIVRAVQHAAGRSLNKEEVRRPSKVVLLNNEDDQVELLRRIGATMAHFEISNEDIDGRLAVRTGYGLKNNKLGWYDSRAGSVETVFPPDVAGAQHTRPLEDLMIALKESDVDILIADPAIGFFQGVAENDNAAVEQVMGIWRRIAAECDVAVWLTHHTGKLQDSESHAGDINAARGASSAIAAARVGYTLARMSRQTAKEQRIPWEDARRLRRMDNAKNNYAPDATDAEWFRMESVPVGNGDFVGVPRPIQLAAIERLPEEMSATEMQEREDVMRLCVEKFSGMSTIPFAKLEADLVEMFGVVVKTVRRKLKDFFPLPVEGGDEDDEIFYQRDEKIYFFHRVSEGEEKRVRHSLVIRENQRTSEDI